MSRALLLICAPDGTPQTQTRPTGVRSLLEQQRRALQSCSIAARAAIRPLAATGTGTPAALHGGGAAATATRLPAWPMGQQPTKEEARLEQIGALLDHDFQQKRSLWPGVAAERAAGIPPVAGTLQAQRAALCAHIMQLLDEMRRLAIRRGACCP